MQNLSNDANARATDAAALKGGAQGRKNKHHQTIYAEEDLAASIGGTISADGTCYMVQLKGCHGLKFYGQGSHADLNESAS